MKDEIATIQTTTNVRKEKRVLLTKIRKKPTKEKGKQTQKAVTVKFNNDQDDKNDACFAFLSLTVLTANLKKLGFIHQFKGWSHEACNGGEHLYICHNCFSD